MASSASLVDQLLRCNTDPIWTGKTSMSQDQCSQDQVREAVTGNDAFSAIALFLVCRRFKHSEERF
jgi:hypothetical protein